MPLAWRLFLMPVLLLFGCDGSSVSCSDVCDKTVTECKTDSSMSECEATCKEVKDALKPSVFETMATCTLESSCAELGTEKCFKIAVNQISDSVSETYIERVCEKMVPCSDSALSAEACVSQSKDSFEGLPDFLKLFKSSLVECFLVCIEGEDCTAIMSNFDDVMASCSKSCGLVFGTTTTSSDGDIPPTGT